VLVTLTQDLGKILSSLHSLKIGGETDFSAALQVAQVLVFSLLAHALIIDSSSICHQSVINTSIRSVINPSSISSSISSSV
jgi:hypothetical protein